MYDLEVISLIFFLPMTLDPLDSLEPMDISLPFLEIDSINGRKKISSVYKSISMYATMSELDLLIATLIALPLPLSER